MLYKSVSDKDRWVGTSISVGNSTTSSYRPVCTIGRAQDIYTCNIAAAGGAVARNVKLTGATGGTVVDPMNIGEAVVIGHPIHGKSMPSDSL